MDYIVEEVFKTDMVLNIILEVSKLKIYWKWF